MNKINCQDCGCYFDSALLLTAHQHVCSRTIFKKGPSFKTKLSKKQLKIRRMIIGSFEWAQVQPNKDTPKRLKKLLLDKTIAVLEKEIVRLEFQLVFKNSPSETDLKRLIAFSHAHNSLSCRNKMLGVIDKTAKINNKLIKKVKEKARKKAVREMHAKLKPDIERTNDLMDVYFKSGERAVSSGGLPSLGKRK
ncbi:hypothetical protein [Aliivibrio fischeri]|uniref:C2H2-type domain-containing protein n=1 Tax=Aliivibrio fischeri TaxID=668 RepID=A0A844P5P4_ALIFS|nr:hypothetical protein [Aliivibrio fischeri]MUK51443.1 hypothetical protein [Aliivibrio fischeri]